MSSVDMAIAPSLGRVSAVRHHGVLIRQLGSELRLVFRRRRNIAGPDPGRACMPAGAMKPRRARKDLAVTAVLLVIMALRKPTGTRLPGMSRSVHRRRTAAARLKGCKASLSCIAKAVRIPSPTAPNDHAKRRSIWR